MSRHAEDTPSFNFQMSFQSNMAFLVAIFILLCALAWALRDHRKRLLDLATEEQEDRLYLTVLGILFVVCTMGSYFAFNQTRTDLKGEVNTSNVLIDELVRGMGHLQKTLKGAYQKGPQYTPDLPVRVPLPQIGDIEAQVEQKQRYPDEEFQSLSFFFLITVTGMATWYFWPRSRPDISHPRGDYAGMRSGATMRSAGAQPSAARTRLPTPIVNDEVTADATGDDPYAETPTADQDQADQQY